MNRRKATATIFGTASLVCSLSFWPVLVLSYILGFPKYLDLPLNSWAAIWALAVILALVAAALGSRRWMIAALIPVVTFFLMIVFINLREPG